MDLNIFIGKGGVGKSTVSAAYATYESYYNSDISKSKSVLLVDYDLGHSLTRVLADYVKDEKQIGTAYRYNQDNNAPMLKTYESNNIYSMNLDNQNLKLAIIDEQEFESFSNFRKHNVSKNIIEYLIQFTGDYGLIPCCDIISTGFGVPIDISEVSKFSSLVRTYHNAVNNRIDKMIIDVEPTAGLERLLTYSDMIVDGRNDLIESNLGTLRILANKLPDVKAYLEGQYIRNIHHYTRRINETVDALRSAKYFIVTTPQRSPVDQADKIEEIIKHHGGKISGFIVNNVEGKNYEYQQIMRLKKKAAGRPMVEIQNNSKLCDIIGSDVLLRRKALFEVGKTISTNIKAV